MWTQLRIGILGAVLGGFAIGGVSYLKDRPKEPAPAIVPLAEVPGYVGPVYDGAGRLVGYSQPVSEPAAAAPAPVQTPAAAAPAPRAQGRSAAKSVAIVGASSAAGAAIGALAGGGKGGAIGAISGGAAGFVYDRHTANKPR